MSDPAARLEELQAQLNARRTAMEDRINSLSIEGGDSELPPLEELKEEQMRLIQEIRHNKDECDTILRELENNEDAINVYRVAAQVQRFEHFTERAHSYLEKDFPSEIEDICNVDKRHSEDEVAAYISSLQGKREEELKRITALQERTTKRAASIRNGPRVDRGARNTRCLSTSKSVVLATEEVKTLAFTDEQRGVNTDLGSKLKNLKEQKSKLQLGIIDEKHRHEKVLNETKMRIRHAELAAKADERLCGELNTCNATLTTNSRILMGQLNGEHYSIENGPSQKDLLKIRHEEEKAAKAKTELNGNENKNGIASVSHKDTYNRTDSQRDRESALKADVDHHLSEGSVQRHSDPCEATNGSQTAQ